MGTIGDNMASILNVSKQEKKVLSFWGIGLLVIIALLVVINIFFPISNVFRSFMNIDSKDDTKYKLVSDFSRYSTVSTSIEKFYSFINMKDIDSVIKILDEKYVKEKNVTSSNIKNYLFITDEFLSFQSGKMYQRKINKLLYYYVEGDVINANTGEFYKKEYYRVVLDGSTFHFSITPVTESDFKEVSDGK